MNKKHLALILSGLFLCLFIYIVNKKYKDKVLMRQNIENKNSENIIASKISRFSESTVIHKNMKSQKSTKEMTPLEYVTWVKDPKDRILLEIRREGAKIYRKYNVTITVMPNGKELYMPDEF